MDVVAVQFYTHLFFKNLDANCMQLLKALKQKLHASFGFRQYRMAACKF